MPLNEYDELAGSGVLHVPGSGGGNEYDSLVQDGHEQQKQQLDASKFVASKRDPARWAKVLEIARRTKLPTDVVDRNFDTISAEDARQRTGSEYDRLISDTPGLSSWLTNPDNATLGRDEVAHLAQIDRGARIVSQKDESGIGYAPTVGGNDLTAAAGNFAAIFGMGDPDRIAQEVASANKRASYLRSIQPDYVKDFQTVMQKYGGDVSKAADEFLASFQDTSRTGIQKVLNEFKTGGVTLGEALSLIGSYATHPRGAIYQQLESIPSVVPMLTGGAAGAALGGPLGLIGGTFIGGVFPSVAGELSAELQKRGIDVTDPDALARAYRDPNLMAALREKASRKGVTSTMVNSLIAPLGGTFLEGAKEAGAGAIAKTAATAADVGVQAGGVGAGDVAGQNAAGEKVDVGQALQSAVATLGYAGGQEAIGATRRGLFHPEPTRAATEAAAQANEALRATRDAQALSEIGTAVSEAKTTQQVPDAMKNLVELATGNDENARVYFQTKDWDEHFQAAGASPAKAVADITGDDGKSYYEAKSTGSPIVIKLADYVARVAPTEHWEPLLKFARTRPDGMSLAEASDYLASLPKTMEEIAGEAANPESVRQDAGLPADESAARVRENVEGQLKAAGVSPSVAKAQASLYEAAFRSLGERAGVDPLELFNRYGLKITSENAPKPAVAPERPSIPAEEIQARTDLQAKAENALERDALNRPDPYMTEASSRDYSVKNDAGELVYARTEGGSLRSNLSKVSVEGLIDEYGRLFKAQNEDQSKVVPTVNSDENMHSNSLGRPYTGLKGDAVNAKGRIAQRAKSIEKIEAELKTRGIENMGELLKDSFDLFQSAAPVPSGESAPIGEGDALQRYQDIVRQLQAFPEERRRMLANALKLPPDILHLKQDERGRILFRGDEGVTIELLKKANRSTFLHETAHFYLEVLSDLGGKEVRDPGINEDLKTIRAWLNADESGSFTRAQHEHFARGFEVYLLDGKAPSAQLRDVFYRFKRWLISIYKDITSLGVELTPEVRKVFDRMLAVDSEIAAVEEQSKARPLFEDPKALGMTDEQAESYTRAVQDAHQAAEEALTVRMMKQIKREESEEWDRWRAPIEEAVNSEVNKRPEYRALAYLRKGENPDGTPVDPSTPVFKISRESVRETYGDEAAKALPHGVTAKDGLHPDLISDIFGYGSGKEFLDAISKAPKKDDLIRQVTDARMQLEHGERLTQLQIRENAEEAVRNAKRETVLRKELEFLASDRLSALKGLVRSVTRLVPPTEAIRDEANKIVGGKSVRDIRPIVFERTAARLAAEARDKLLAGDVEGAFNAKRKELLTNEVFRAATDARESIDKALDEFRKVFRPEEQLSKSRDMDLVNAARAILANFGLGRSEKPAFAYLEQIKRYDREMGETVAGMVNEATSASPVGTDYRALSYDDFTAMRETVNSLWNLSRRSRQIEIDGQKLDRAQVQKDLAARIAEIGSKPIEQAGYKRAVTNWEKTERNLMTARSWLRRVEHWVDAMDGGVAGGVFRRYVWNPVSEGATAYRVAKRSALEKYLDVVKPIEKGVKAGTIEARELDYRFESKAELLGALLHTGNESNLQKLLRGRGWGEYSETGALDRSRWDAFVARMIKEGVLTKADFDYAQGVWDLFDELKAGAQRAHKEMYGHYFDEVTAQPFDTPFGNYRGGYVPAKADPFIVPEAQLRRDQEALTSAADNSFMFPTAGRGFTKSRVEAYAKPLIMDVGYVPSHIDAVLRFTHIEPRVRDVARMMTSRSFRAELDSFDPTVGSSMIVPWLQRAAQQRIDLPGKFPALDTFWRELRNRTGLQIMTANVLNALQQFTGLSISLVKVDTNNLASALWQYVRSPKETAAQVNAKSDFMRTRMTAGVIEIQKRIDDIMLDPSKYEKVREFAREHGYFAAAGTQHVVDYITWMGAYDGALAKGVSDGEAVRVADSAVRETQGSFAPEDISRAESQTPFVRAFLQFYGYFNMQANLMGTEFANTVRSMGLKKGAGRLLFIYAMGFAIPGILSDGIMRAGSNKPFDSDDDGPWDDVFGLFFGSQLRSASRFIPVIGPAIDATIGAFTKSTTDDDIRTAPAISTVEKAVRAPADVYHAIKEREIRSKDVTDVLTAVGLLTGLPTAPIARPINYLRGVSSGKIQPKNLYDFGRGLVTGR